MIHDDPGIATPQGRLRIHVTTDPEQRMRAGVGNQSSPPQRAQTEVRLGRCRLQVARHRNRDKRYKLRLDVPQGLSLSCDGA